MSQIERTVTAMQQLAGIHLRFIALAWETGDEQQRARLEEVYAADFARFEALRLQAAADAPRPHVSHDADDITPQSILAVLRGEGPDEIGRDYDALDRCMDLGSVLEEIATDPVGTRELITALSKNQGRFPRAQAILLQHVDTAVAESGNWLDIERQDQERDRAADRAAEEQFATQGH